MFGKRKKGHAIEVTKLASLIAEGVEVTGDIAFASGMRIDGRVNGNVIGRSSVSDDDVGTRGVTLLVLSDSGHIEGSVRCGDAVVNGTVTGDLDVEHFLELQANARVRGTIRYRQLQMDVGAVVHGQLVKVEAPATNVVELAGEALAERAAGG
jgi:cytoskeletal protein CcmA (bactofilin family)